MNERRSFFKRVGALLASFGIGTASAGSDVRATGRSDRSVGGKVRTGAVVTDQQVPLFSGSVTHNGLVYVAGKGAHIDGDITDHTEHVLDEIEKELEEAGSSMDQVLKVNVYLHDLVDYDAMNAAYRGRFGENPPVRTTVATYGGVPGDSLVEIDCIAAVE